MKVKATQTLTNYLKKNLAGYGFHFLKMGLEQYQRTVDYDIFANDIDFNPAKNEMSVIQVVYPDEFCALPRFLTTRDLARIFSRSDKTAAGFLNAIRENIEI